jgi:cation-transporting ATPase E
LGAPEILLGDNLPSAVIDAQNQGLRTLVMTRENAGSDNSKELMATIICREKIRENAPMIIKYFRDSGVNVRIVSGDNLKTVQQIARTVGVDSDNVIGRAKPETKLQIVRELQRDGKIVAMTGDGVNDMLALKEADLGIAMGNAAPASKAVANLVLVDGDFGKLPAVISQGRRVIANIERVASLFLVKTVYSIVLTLATVVIGGSYPFLPRHLTLVSALTIGIPAFFLALPPNNTPYHPGFLNRVLKFSVPAGVISAIFVIISRNVLPDYTPTIQIIVLLACAFTVLLSRSRPVLSWRGVMFLILVGLTVLTFIIPFTSDFFALYVGA